MIATVVSNVISAVMIWYFLVNEKSDIQLSHKKLSISKEELINILKVGLPAGLQGLVFSFSNVCIQAAINGYGSDAVAGSSVALNYEYIAYFIIASFNQAAVTFTSQNFGAKNYDRCKKVFRICMILGMVITGCTSLIFVANRTFFASLFTSDQKVIKYAIERMVYILTINFIANTYEVGGSALRGIGYSMTPSMLTVFGTCVFRLFWIYAVCPKYPVFGNLLIVYPISWVITGSAVLVVYFVIRKRVFSEDVGKNDLETSK